MSIAQATNLLVMLILSILIETEVVANYENIKLFTTPVNYDVHTAVLLNDVEKKDKEVGYNIKASLAITPLWSGSDSEFLLEFSITSAVLYFRGKYPIADLIRHKSVWDSKHTKFYGHWRDGSIQSAYLNPADPVEILNYKKSMLSLFQFQLRDGERHETDISGQCRARYELAAHDQDLLVRKEKIDCRRAAQGERASEDEWRRMTRYTLTGGVLDSLVAEELLMVRLPTPSAALGIKARAWHRLQATEGATVPNINLVHSLEEALKILLENVEPMSLEAKDPLTPPEQRETVAEVLAALNTAEGLLEEAGGGGTAAEAAVALRLVAALEAITATTAHQLETIVKDPDNAHLLPALMRAMGAAGTRAAHAAAVALRPQLSHVAPLADTADQLAATYLDALALASHPEVSVILDVLRLGEAGGVLADRALATAGAATHNLPPAAANTVRDALARGLARAPLSRRASWIVALGNTRRPDVVDAIVQHAEGGGPGAHEALSALYTTRPGVLDKIHVGRLTLLALNGSADVDVRAVALELVVREHVSAAAAAQGVEGKARAALLKYLLLRLHRAPPSAAVHELRRVLWALVQDAADSPAGGVVQEMLSRLPPELNTWDSRAPAGTSSAVERELWRGVAVRSVQLADRGTVRRGVVRFLLQNAPVTALDLHLWTRGLHQDESDAEDEEAAAGLGFGVSGARRPDITLFTGQAELLSHAWAGTCSTPTPALRSLRHDRAHVTHALVTGAVLHTRWERALVLALDAHAQVSLWSRTVRAGLAARGAGAASLSVRTFGDAELHANVSGQAEGQLGVSVDLDFYSKPVLCVRVRSHELRTSYGWSLRGARGVRRSRSSRWVWPGRTLSVGGVNSAACRELVAAGSDDP